MSWIDEHPLCFSVVAVPVIFFILREFWEAARTSDKPIWFVALSWALAIVAFMLFAAYLVKRGAVDTDY